MIDFKPKSLNIVERVRGNKLVVNDSIDGVSSATFHFEKLQINEDTGEIHQHLESTSVVVPQAMTDEQKSQTCYIFELNGEPRTEPLIIPPNPTREQIEQFTKLLTNSMLINHLTRQDNEIFD